MENNQRITKQELEKIYGVDRTTIEVWRKRYGLPIIEISSHSKYIRREDLIDWEDRMKTNLEVEV
ncbi:helix-turn-helix domain-containing protein [Maribacter sp. ACAM166]|uniref:helix-turn-helix domain-containing protein n=1 Tax=Maribacter sp. ACAM166 TaxID=2508996 RepID=UPI0010FD2C87|nr:helix-turn-helix domain-containing protein [Maribacter sp. ACAM166]TLP73235.1 helix-turn-helix domain-containing protein [Maribacter sp. ACAM166]